MKINVIEERPVKIRDALVPSPGYVWVSCDYSQLEYRTMANLAEEKQLIDSFMAGVDFHTATASMMLGIPVDQVDKKARKIGKCVTGDTLIYSPSHGIIRIDEISDFREEDQFTPLTGFKVINMDGEVCDADSFYYGGVRKVTNIITRYGFKLGGSTDKHRIIVLDEKGFPVYKKMADLTLDDKVVIYLGGFEKETDEYVKFTLKPEWFYQYSQDHPAESTKDRQILDALKEVGGYRKDAADLLGISENSVRYVGRKYSVPSGLKNRPERFMLNEVTEYVAELWGMLLADGHFKIDSRQTHHGSSVTTFGSADWENIDRFVYLCKQLWPDYELYIKNNPTPNGTPFWNVFINSTVVTDQLSCMGKFNGNKSKNLFIPKEIMMSKTSVKAAFLAGWFNGDGCFTDREASTCSISKQFIYDMQSLFGSMGMLAKVWSETPTTMKGTDYLAWKLALVDDQSHFKFYDLVSDLLIERKRDKFTQCIDRFKENKSCLQVAYNLKEAVQQSMPGLTHEQRKGKYRHLNKDVNSYGYACLSDVCGSDSLSDEYKTVINRYLDRKIIAVPIKEIYETEEPVYDFHVPNGHQFVANSILNSNTLNFGVSYGMSVNGLAQRLGCSKEEAQEKQNLYFKNIPKLKDLINKTKATTKARGYSRTFFGRMRPFKKQLENAVGNWYKEDSILKQSFNTCVQGTGADFAKIALGRAYLALKQYGDRVRILTQVHDEINYEVKCVNPDGSIDSEFLADVLKTIDYAMSFRGIYPGWADIPADIEIGWNYGSLMGPEEIKEQFGVDVLAIQANQPPTDLPKFLFENLNYDVINKSDLKAAEKSLHLNKKGDSKGSGTAKQDAKSTSDGNADKENQGSSKGQEMAKKLEQKMRSGGKIEGRLDLTGAQFRTNTVLIHLKDGVNESLAFDKLKSHVNDNFGNYDIVLEHQGILYRFHADFRINSNVDGLREFFDVDLFEVKPVVKLEL